ncbi:WD40 repeat-containing protein [Cryptosporidium ubiquitum]|uniref:WD40 repeat-containing protein n=1 Tax=Cryptosporidium ubiquitum TaxID=857276 RepID=A0A1J4MAG0_9CRYT|nr:WD40 repeat-containing protein [Cryptosporidium ubiquitum]OII70991.1 WD40 repeat-containing protein [Cryptosporidium ubiquitum]
MGKKIKNLTKKEAGEVWEFQSKYSENSIRQVFFSYNKILDDQLRIVIQTNETSSIEILQFSDQKLYSRTWCPQENRIGEEFDFMQISSCLYSKDYACIGFSNGSVRLYNFPKTELLESNQLKQENSNDQIDDHYYNTMFGDSQEIEEDKESNTFWLDDPSLKNLPSRLLMKHMGYPICIKERNGIIFVLYDDGALMSTTVESSMGYNVIRYDGTFQGGINFSLNPKGDKIAVSTINRKLIVSSLEVKELNEKNDDGIRSCKLLFESQIFKKSLFQKSKKSGNPYNCLVLEWSSCGEYIYLPGEAEVRILPINENPKEIKYFISEVGMRNYGLDICIIKEIEYNQDKRILVSLSIEGEVRVYILGLGMSDIREVNTFMLKNKSMKELYPVSLDLFLKRSGDSINNEEFDKKQENKQDFLYISSVLNSGELILNKFQLDFETYNIINVIENKNTGIENYDSIGEKTYTFSESSNSKRFDDKDLDKSFDENLLWDDVEVDEGDIKEKSDLIKVKKTKSGNLEDNYKENREKQRRSGLRKVGNEKEMVEEDIFEEDLDEFEHSMNDLDGDQRIKEMDNSDGQIEDEDLDFEEEEDEYEYESWDKREFGRHIEHLKVKIEKLKSMINNGNESQPPVHPGYTGDNEILDSLNEENREFLYCWNQSGYISYSIDEEGRPSIDMECYNSMDGPKKLRVYDTKGYNMACIGMDGYLLGRKSKVLENGTVVPSIIDYNIWRTWGRSDKSGWSKTLLNGEDLISMTCSRDFVAVMTSLRYLRIWRNSGINVSVTKLVGSPVCCVSNESYLLVVTQREPFYVPKNKLRIGGNIQEGIISGRCNTYEILFLDVGQETLIYSDIMSISPETIIKWCGISNKGVPIIQDTSGQTFMLSRQWKNQKENWVPITNFGLLESSTSCKYFILGINEDHFNVLKLPDGLDNPIPIMAKNNSNQNYSTIKIPFNIPILGLPSIRQWMNIIENDPTLNECITNNNISWEIIDELRIKLDLMQGNISILDEFSCHKDSNQYKQYKLQREKLLMRLYMKLVIKQLVEPAFDVVRMFNFPKSFQIALEQAEKSGERILANKISQEIQMRSKYEQEKSEKTCKIDTNKGFGKTTGISSSASEEENTTTKAKNKSNIENININDEKNKVSTISQIGSPSKSTPSSYTISNTTSATNSSVNTISSFKMNNPFNTKTKTGVEKSSLKNLSKETNNESQHDEISQTIQYCSDIIKKRKM